jgi:hypothetical protein
MKLSSRLNPLSILSLEKLSTAQILAILRQIFFTIFGRVLHPLRWLFSRGNFFMIVFPQRIIFSWEVLFIKVMELIVFGVGIAVDV